MTQLDPYPARGDTGEADRSAQGERGGYGVGGVIALFLLLAAISFFLPFALAVDIGIMHHVQGAAGTPTGSNKDPFFWLLATAGGALVLGLGILYGQTRAEKRQPQDLAAERVTRDLYRNAARDDERGLS